MHLFHLPLFQEDPDLEAANNNIILLAARRIEQKRFPQTRCISNARVHRVRKILQSERDCNNLGFIGIVIGLFG